MPETLIRGSVMLDSPSLEFRVDRGGFPLLAGSSVTIAGRDMVTRGDRVTLEEQAPVDICALVSNPAEKEDDKKPLHRGRIQAQGGGTEKSVAWARATPPTRSEGQAMLAALGAQLTRSEKRKRKDALKQARVWIDRTAATGGIHASTKKTFPPRPVKGIRIDIEVISGKAFVPDS